VPELLAVLKFESYPNRTQIEARGEATSPDLLGRIPNFHLGTHLGSIWVQ
jgi:hypothetical protein